MSQPDVSPDETATTGWAGLGHGLLSLFGAGDLYNPLGDLNSELSSAKDNLTNTINIYTQQALNKQVQFDQDLLQFIAQPNLNLQKTQEYYHDISTNTHIQQNYFITILLILVIIIIFFMLIK